VICNDEDTEGRARVTTGFYLGERSAVFQILTTGLESGRIG